MLCAAHYVWTRHVDRLRVALIRSVVVGSIFAGVVL